MQGFGTLQDYADPNNNMQDHISDRMTIEDHT